MYTIYNTTYHEWFERDRAHVRIDDITTGNTIVEFWDEAVSEAIEDGFLELLNSKLRPYCWHQDLCDLANENLSSKP